VRAQTRSRCSSSTIAGGRPRTSPGWHCRTSTGCASCGSEGPDDLTAAIEAPRYRELLEASAERFVDRQSVIEVAAEESVKFDRGFGRVKFIGLSRRHPAMSHDDWCRYWIDVHGPLAHGIPEFTRYYGRYVHNYVLPVGLGPSGQLPEHDGIVEEWLESVEDMPGASPSRGTSRSCGPTR